VLDSGSLGGWYVGLVVGSVMVFAVVVLVAVILQLARRLGLQNRDIADALAAIRKHTAAMPAVDDINSDTARVNDSLARLRDLLGATSIGGHL
jgi:hypothetical protein